MFLSFWLISVWTFTFFFATLTATVSQVEFIPLTILLLWGLLNHRLLILIYILKLEKLNQCKVNLFFLSVMTCTSSNIWDAYFAICMPLPTVQLPPSLNLSACHDAFWLQPLRSIQFYNFPWTLPSVLPQLVARFYESCKAKQPLKLGLTRGT